VTERSRKGLLAAAVVVLLLPLTLLTAILVMLSYPAYPIPNPGVLQIVFDVAMALQVAAIVAAWRLSGGFFRAGAQALARTHRAWLALLGIGAVIGIVGAGFAIEHAINPRTAEDHVGFALLSPALALVPIWLFLWRQNRRATPSTA
jgi:hypothetical protein